MVGDQPLISALRPSSGQLHRDARALRRVGLQCAANPGPDRRCGGLPRPRAPRCWSTGVHDDQISEMCALATVGDTALQSGPNRRVRRPLTSLTPAVGADWWRRTGADKPHAAHQAPHRPIKIRTASEWSAASGSNCGTDAPPTTAYQDHFLDGSGTSIALERESVVTQLVTQADDIAVRNHHA
jgi:hypothetical protein